MATRTFLQLKTALASMWGYEDVADLLAQDQADIDSIINAAYFDCYVPTDGTRAYWPEKYHSDILKAPVVATLGMTNGSTIVTGYVFEAKYAGSFVQIGDRFYRYAVPVVTAGPVTTYNLVQPWDGDTGPQEATIYHNAVVLPWSIVELAGKPGIFGLGLLAPLPGADTELLLRSGPPLDFLPVDGGAQYPFGRRQFIRSLFYATGEPCYYHIDQASVATPFALGNRFHVYPLPNRVMTFDFTANIAPAPLVADDDIPAVPGNGVDNILLPIAREKLANNSAGRRYTGPNVASLTKEADRARAQLTSLRRVQKDVPATMRLKRGW